MSIIGTRKVRTLTVVCGLSLFLSLLLTVAPQALAQDTAPQNMRIQNTNTQAIPNGAKLKFKGVVISRDADTFTIRDRNRTNFQVLLTDRTSIKTHGGFL